MNKDKFEQRQNKKKIMLGSPSFIASSEDKSTFEDKKNRERETHNFIFLFVLDKQL